MTGDMMVMVHDADLVGDDRKGAGLAVEEALLSLAALAGRTVVAAAATDAWESVKRGFARVLASGDRDRAGIAERRLEQTREQLAGAAAGELERIRGEVAVAWQVRLLDLLEEHPEIAGELRALIDQVWAHLPTGAVSASGHGVAVGGDVTITASRGGIAAGTISGNVTPENPTRPGPAIP
jgi:hypothetical protein